jgi:hypothetical protein
MKGGRKEGKQRDERKMYSGRKKGEGMNSKIKSCTKFRISNIWLVIKYMRPEKYN